jgi:hypothetical protein
MRFGTVAERLREEGVPFEASPARARLSAALVGAGTPPNPCAVTAPAFALLGAARAGLMPRGAWDGVLGDAQVQRVLLGRGPLREAAITEWLVRAAAAAPLPDEVRSRLAARSAAAQPEPETQRALETLDHLARMCALLGHPLDGPEATARARAALSRRWAARPGQGHAGGGFASDSMPREIAARAVHQVDPTLAAVRLMRRFGVPAEIDLDVLEAYLRRAATPSLVEALAPAALEMLSIQSYRHVARVALDELDLLRAEALIPRPRRHALARLVDGRLLLCAVALVGLCLATLAQMKRGTTTQGS